MTETVIGPSFAAEIEAAGLMGLPFAWSSEGVTFGGDLTTEQRAAIEAVVAAHAPAVVGKRALIAHLKALRWQLEIAGVTVTIGGEPVLVSTARGDDRAALHQEFSAIGAGLRPEGSPFNFADGIPRAVSNADMQTAILAALSHVRAAFGLELTLTAQIEAETLTTLEAIDAAFA